MNTSTLVYPLLGSEHDLWYTRVSGHGLGNSFYTYFHAAVLAGRDGGRMIFPAWLSLKLGPLLRGENSKRFYWRMFKPSPDELRGAPKLAALLPGRARHAVQIARGSQPKLAAGALNLVSSREFTFEGLHASRALIRERLLNIVNDPVPAGHRWGGGDYIGVHVRLGDFAAPADPKALLSGKANTRIPMTWYQTVMRSLREKMPGQRIYLFSDGKEAELRPLLDLGAELYRSGSDITDLLAMAGARMLVGSNSTFSRWAVFLGDMPSVWIRKDVAEEKPSAAQSDIFYVPMDAASARLWN